MLFSYLLKKKFKKYLGTPWVGSSFLFSPIFFCCRMAWAFCSSTRMGSSWRTESRSSSSRSMPRRSTPEKYVDQNTHIQNSASRHSATSSSLVTPNFNSGLVSIEIQFLQQWSNRVILLLYLYLYSIFLEMYWSKLQLAAVPGAGADGAGDAARCPLTSGMFVVESGLWLACLQQMGSLCCSCLRATAFFCS